MTPSTKTLMTAEKLLDRSSELGRCELIRGELIKMSPAGYEHGSITMRLGRLIGDYAEEHGLGEVCSSETGFVLERDPDTVREADIPFIRAERVPKEAMRGYYEGPPDLAVEVISPSDRASEVAEKVELWLNSGAQCVWVVDPRRQTVTVHDDPKSARVLHRDDTLEGGELLPGFAVRVQDVFKP